MKETEELFNPLPPHSTEAEKGILACILIDPENCLSICAAEIDAEKFYGRNNQIIYQAMMDLSESRKQVDTITIYSRIKSHGLEHESGGIEYISTLPDYTPSARNLQFYIDIVTEKATLRGIIRVANDLLRRAYDHGNNAPTELLDIAERDILALATMRRDIEPTHIKKLLRGTLDQIESYMANPNSHPGIPTGFADFEQLTGGLQPSEMVVLAARPSVGKTALAMNIAENIGTRCGVGVGFFSLEMTKEALAMRLLCGSAGISSHSVTRGALTNGDLERLTSATATLAKANIVVDDTPGLTVMQIRNRARKMYSKHNVRVIIIDYLQLIQSTHRQKGQSRERDVAEISAGIKSLAKEIKVPIVILCQLNRGIENESNRKPRLSDLRESGAIEQDSDVVLMLSKVPLTDKEKAEDNQSEIMVVATVAKNRCGPTGEFELKFVKRLTKFQSVSRFSPE